jgi:hypothetical protein
MGVSNRSLVRRLRAWNVGAPIARGQTVHTAVSDPENRFLLAFVRMGGESRPWGVAWKKGTNPVKFRSIGEPRTRAFVDEMLVELSHELAEHLGHPMFAEVLHPSEIGQPEFGSLPQVWVPNSSHIDMLHFLAYAYIRRKGESEDDAALRMLGRVSLHLFLESRRPGQQIIIDASSALRSAYDFPCEDARQAHLGLLIAWLENRGERDKGLQAALEAERLPVAISLDPELERNPLSDLVDRYNQTRTGWGKGDKKIEKQIHDVLSLELDRRIGLVKAAIEHIENDERDYNEGLEVLLKTTSDQLYWGLLRAEDAAFAADKEPFAADPETDRDPRSATFRYFMNAAAQDRERNALIHFDRELEAEAINDGAAFRGIITTVSDEGNGRKTIPVWTVVDQTPGSLSLRQHDKVCVVGFPKRTGVVREIAPLSDGSLEVTVEITGMKTANSENWPHRMAGADQSWLGIAVTLIGTSFADMTENKARKALSRDSSPGDWMLATNRRPVTTGEDGE